MIGHEQFQDCPRHYYYNNTSIGAHNHRLARVAILTEGSGNMDHDGSSTSIFPYSRGWNIEEWISRNNICAVRPNGSTGSSSGTTGGPSGDSHAGIVVQDNSIGRNLSSHTFSQDYNLYHRGAGMPNGTSAGVITTLNASGAETARNSITDVRNDTGREQNGRIVDPQFVGAWDHTKLDGVLHRNAQWGLGAGSPAASGGDTTDRTWPDMDFGVQVNYLGNTWIGCMDPQASAVEQQVGPLGTSAFRALIAERDEGRWEASANQPWAAFSNQSRSGATSPRRAGDPPDISLHELYVPPDQERARLSTGRSGRPFVDRRTRYAAERSAGPSRCMLTCSGRVEPGHFRARSGH